MFTIFVHPNNVDANSNPYLFVANKHFLAFRLKREGGRTCE